MFNFRRGRKLLRDAKPRALAETAEPSLRELLRDPIIRSRMAADSIRIRDILDLAIAFRNSTADRKRPLVCGPILASIPAAP